MPVFPAGSIPRASKINPLFAYKSADTSMTSTTTLTNDPHLSVTYVAGAVYTISGLLIPTCAADTVDLKLDFTFGASSTLDAIGVVGMGTSGVGGFDTTGFFGAKFANTGGTMAALFPIGVTAQATANILTGFLTAGGSGGTFQLRWAPNASSVSAVILRQGSFLRLDRVV